MPDGAVTARAAGSSCKGGLQRICYSAQPRFHVAFFDLHISHALVAFHSFEQIVPLFFPAGQSILLHTVAMSSNEDAATVAGAVLIALDIVTVAGRFYSRWFTKAGFGWDDWTILVAMLTGILPGALTIWGAFFCFVSPFPNPSGRIRFCIATYMFGDYTCMPWMERTNKTDAPISEQCISNWARCGQQLQPRLRLH